MCLLHAVSFSNLKSHKCCDSILSMIFVNSAWFTSFWHHRFRMTKNIYHRYLSILAKNRWIMMKHNFKNKKYFKFLELLQSTEVSIFLCIHEIFFHYISLISLKFCCIKVLTLVPMLRSKLKTLRFEFSIGIFLWAENYDVLQFQLWKRNELQ
jgi:hypothetical protein